MAIRPSTPEIITVNSEALQTQIRDLLPSQNGFGSELQASNVITPIIDLTAAAEGSGLPVDLQQAYAFGSNTAFSVTNTSSSLTTNPGFYRVSGVVSMESNITGSNPGGSINISDGLSTKQVWAVEIVPINVQFFNTVEFDIVVFLRAGDDLIAQANDANTITKGSFRQIATGDGTLVNPSGFPL